jgi:hypothetical protein
MIDVSYVLNSFFIRGERPFIGNLGAVCCAHKVLTADASSGIPHNYRITVTYGTMRDNYNQALEKQSVVTRAHFCGSKQV